MTHDEYLKFASVVVRSPMGLTDRELAQIRRTIYCNPEILRRTVAEQGARGLLYANPKRRVNPDRLSYADWSGYLPEKTKRIRDYPVDRISPYVSK
jgi:hypothetical protein